MSKATAAVRVVTERTMTEVRMVEQAAAAVVEVSVSDVEDVVLDLLEEVDDFVEAPGGGGAGGPAAFVVVFYLVAVTVCAMTVVEV